MSEYVVLSDIHSNNVALDAVLADSREQYPDAEYIVLGDLLGQLGEPDETVMRVQRFADHVVFGNHDARIRSDFSYVPQMFPDGDDRQLVEHRIVTSSLTEESIEWLSQLPERITVQDGDTSLEIAHAHPFEQPHHGFPAIEHDMYVSKRDWTEFASSHLDANEIALFGHTHTQGKLNCAKFDELNGAICNPGSVGSPIDDDARWAHIDTDGPTITLHRTFYPMGEVESRMETLMSDTDY